MYSGTIHYKTSIQLSTIFKADYKIRTSAPYNILKKNVESTFDKKLSSQLSTFKGSSVTGFRYCDADISLISM